MNRFTAIAMICATALLAPEVRADNTADEADLRFKRGVEFYRAKKFEDALAEFFQANRLVRNKNVILNIARCYEQLRQFDEAYRYYDEVLAEYSKAEDRRGVEESLARLAPQVALVRVESDSPGADIFVERKDLGSRGTTPKTLALPPGKANIILSLAGYRDASQRAVLTTGRTATVNLPLEFIYGAVELSGSPEGAQVRVDKSEGPADGVLPGTLKLKPGRHILQISAADYLSTQLPVDVKADESVKAEAKLQPLPAPTGNLMVTANHDGALVRVDGKAMGFTPAVVPLPVGKHRLAVEMAEMRSFQKEVEILQDKSEVVTAELRYSGGVTTAVNKSETAVEDAPASVTIISREEIQAFGYTSLPEALRAVRGMSISNDRSYDYLGVRGFSPPGDYNNRVLILYDGHPMNDIYAGQAYFGHENNIDLNEVERIEVVRGPVSSLFGSAAFFGVINIVPRHKLASQKAELSGAAGSLGLGRVRATAGTEGESGEFLLSLGALRATGQDLYLVPADAHRPETLVRDRDDEQAVNGDARARLGEFSLLGTINSRTKDIPTGIFGTALTGSQVRIIDQRGFVEGRWDHATTGGSTLAARAYYDATRYRGVFPYQDGTTQTDRGGADWGGAELRFRSAEWLGQNLTLGLEVQEQFRIYQIGMLDGVTGLNDTRQFTIASAYAGDELRLGSRLLINASARADYYVDSFGLQVNPRLAIIGKPWGGGITKLMGGRSFRAPTANERYYYDGYIDPVTHQPHYVTSRPNPDVKPETILTAELEHTQEIGDNLRVVGAAFVNRLSDLVLTLTDDHGLSYWSNAQGTVQTRGAEAELRWQPARLSMVSVAYWYQQMVIDNLDAGQENRLRSNTPAHAFSIKGMFPIAAPFLVGAAEAVYNSSRRTSDGAAATGEMLWLNLGLSGQLPGGSFRYFAGVQNLLNEQVRLPVGFEVPGETVPTYGRTFVLQVAAAY